MLNQEHTLQSELLVEVNRIAVYHAVVSHLVIKNQISLPHSSASLSTTDCLLFLRKLLFFSSSGFLKISTGSSSYFAASAIAIPHKTIIAVAVIPTNIAPIVLSYTHLTLPTSDLV